MRRLNTLLLMLTILCLPFSALSEKAHSFPAYFQVTYTVSERKTNNDQSFVSKEYVNTIQPEVDR